MALDAGANCIAVACPLCQQNLDLRQSQPNKTTGNSFRIPVLYFTQIMGLAYGRSPKELGMDKVIVSADELIRSRVTVQEALAAKEKAEAEKKEAARKSREAGKKPADAKEEN
jgi:heterodisulfide reductase subunit B2